MIFKNNHIFKDLVVQKVLYNNIEGVLDFSSTNKISSTKRAYFEQI